MNKSTSTIYDVAKTAGVSIATVSRVLNEPQKVNEDTRSKVLSAIDRLGYIPKAEARARALKETRRIGILTSFFTAPSYVQRLRGITSALYETNYESVIYSVNSLHRLQSYLETLPLTGNLDGLIVLSLRVEDHFAKRIVDRGLETVLIEYPNRYLNSVEIDDTSGGKMVAEYFLKKGHQRFGFLGDTNVPEYSIYPINNRLEGYKRTLLDAGAELPDSNIFLVSYDLEAARQKAHEIFSMPKPPTAIFAATDLQAMGVLRAARERGLRVPKDVAIIGFDDLDMADYIGLTTVSQHLDESGRIAVELLLSRMTDPSRPVRHVKLSLDLIERETA
jgi:DNA-binding LacI/PurR family transcriptional regulator